MQTHKMSTKAKFLMTALIAVFATIFAANSFAQTAVNFEPPTYTPGSINGQDGWSSTGSAPNAPGYDHAVVTNNANAPVSFGLQSFRMSNAVTSGSFGDQTFSKSNPNEAGETSAQNGGMSGGTRQRRFEIQFSIASFTPAAQQPGLAATVSPDRGDGARMSFLRFEDQADGIHVIFIDYQDLAPFGGALGDVNGCDVNDDFFPVDIATLDRSQPHTIRFVMDFVEGPRNDIVQIFVDGVLQRTGTSWEDYFRYCEGNPTRTVDSLLFRSSGTAVPANAGKGFLFDNMNSNAVASPATLVVDDDGLATAADCDAVTPASPTIQLAVNSANAGDTIKVCPGTYAERVTVNKTLTLNGAQSGVDARNGRTGLPATESVVTANANGETPFHITANNVTIDGFTVQGNTNGNVFGAGIFPNAGTNGTDILNNIIQNNIIGLYLVNNSAVNQMVVQRNLFRNNNQPGPASGHGIYTDQFVSGGTLTNVLIDNNTFTGNNGPAVNLASTQAASQTNITVSNNVSTGNGNGILFESTANSSITGNTIENSIGSQVGIFSSSSISVTCNSVRNGQGRGIRVEDFGGGASSSVTINNNNIVDNAGAGLEVGAGAHTGTLNAENNWWGSPTGPTIASNPGGTGDDIVDPSGTVDFTPFLTAPANCAPTTVADLAVDLTVTPDPAASGANLTYQISLSNNGAVAAQNIVLTQTDFFTQRGARRLVVQSITAPPGFTCQTGPFNEFPTAEVVCRGATLGAGQTVQFTIVKRQQTPLAPGTVINHEARATTETVETNTANNRDTDSTTIQ